MRVIEGELKPGLYRLDEPITKGCSSTWLERISICNGEVNYLEEYVLVRNRQIVRMISASIIV